MMIMMVNVISKEKKNIQHKVISHTKRHNLGVTKVQ